jgi:hypothetical protein
MKYIKEFKNYHSRDYEYIKDRLIHLYSIPVTDEDLKSFEDSKNYKESFSDQDYIKNFIKNYMEYPEFEEEIIENVGTVNMGTVAGMGPVVGSMPSSVPGQTTSAGGFSTPSAGDSFGEGGVVGSGDIGSGWVNSIANNSNVRKRDSNLPRSRRGNKAMAALKSMKKAKKSSPFTVKPNNEVDFKNTSGIKSFSEFFKK